MHIAVLVVAKPVVLRKNNDIFKTELTLAGNEAILTSFKDDESAGYIKYTYTFD